MELKLPEIGENISQGTVTKVLVKVGDSIKKGQNILELETDKAVVEIPSNMDGTISEVLVQAGAVIKIGQPVFKLGDSAAAPVAGCAQKGRRRSTASWNPPAAPPPADCARAGAPGPPSPTALPRTTPRLRRRAWSGTREESPLARPSAATTGTRRKRFSRNHGALRRASSRPNGSAEPRSCRRASRRASRIVGRGDGALA